MKTIEISGSLREKVGKKEAAKLRKQKAVPCILYGGNEQVYFSAEELSFKDLVYTPDAHQVKLKIDGKEYNAVLQDIQFHPVEEIILHADFLEIFPDKPVAMEIPVKLTGDSKGVIKGGKLHLKQRKLKVKGLPDKLPQFIPIDITDLDIGDGVKVSEIDMEGVTFLNAPNSIVVAVKLTRVTVEEEEEEAAEAAEGAEAEGEEGKEEAKAEE